MLRSTRNRAGGCRAVDGGSAAAASAERGSSRAHQPGFDASETPRPSRRRRSPTSTATWISGRSGPPRSSRRRGRGSARRRATAAKPGDRLDHGGRFEIGKNVPENRNSGVIPNRNIGVELLRRPLGGRERRDRRGEGHARQDGGRDAEQDQRRGRPPRTAAMTAVKIAGSRSAGTRSRRGCRRRCRGARSACVHRMERPLQVSPPMIGNVASKAAACIVVAARRPGREELRGTTARRARRRVPTGRRRSRARRRSPAGTGPGSGRTRRSTPRNVRRYCSARSSTTRVMTVIGASLAIVHQGAAGQPQEDVLEGRRGGRGRSRAAGRVHGPPRPRPPRRRRRAGRGRAGARSARASRRAGRRASPGRRPGSGAR